MLRALIVTVALLTGRAALSAGDNELDALKLQAEPAKPATQDARPLSAFVEAGWGGADLRFGPGSQTLGRAVLDLRYSSRLSAGWRVAVSNRLDWVHPEPPTTDATINTLREAYAGWQNDEATWAVEIGRINLRNGPAYGFNPTDFFRDGSQRTLTSPDPVRLRENRMGTVVLRVQNLWATGSLSAVLAPKLTEQGPSQSGASLDLGATNSSSRLSLALSQQLPGGVSAQLLAFKPAGASAQWGANAAAQIGDAWVLHGELSGGRERTLASRAFGVASQAIRAERATLGATVSPGAGLSVTIELQHNGFALDERQWSSLAALGGAAGLTTYLLAANQRQDLAARRAVMVYVSKKNLALRNLDLTALVRSNLDDRSHLAWLELRYSWPSVEAAVQWQSFGGRPLSEFGVLPYRHSLLALVTYRF